MSDDYIRLCILLHSLQIEIAALLQSIEAGELESGRAADTARSMLSATVRTLSV